MTKFQWSNEQLDVLEGPKEGFRFQKGNTTDVLMFRKLGAAMETWKHCSIKMHVAIWGKPSHPSSKYCGWGVTFSSVFLSMRSPSLSVSHFLIQSRLWSFWWRWRVCDFLMTWIRGRCYHPSRLIGWSNGFRNSMRPFLLLDLFCCIWCIWIILWLMFVWGIKFSFHHVQVQNN